MLRFTMVVVVVVLLMVVVGGGDGVDRMQMVMLVITSNCMSDSISQICVLTLILY